MATHHPLAPVSSGGLSTVWHRRAYTPAPENDLARDVGSRDGPVANVRALSTVGRRRPDPAPRASRRRCGRMAGPAGTVTYSSSHGRLIGDFRARLRGRAPRSAARSWGAPRRCPARRPLTATSASGEGSSSAAPSGAAAASGSSSASSGAAAHEEGSGIAPRQTALRCALERLCLV